jgi:hypothetical protein
MDFNEASKQVVPDSLIPHGTVVPVHLTLRPGGAGEGGWLKRTKDGTGAMLDCEFTVVEGQYARRKFWSLFMIDGKSEGQQKASEISRSRLRAVLESARGIDPGDESEQAIAARRVDGFAGFDGLRFWAVVGIEKGKGEYKDKNVLTAVVTPDQKGWIKLEQTVTAKPAPAAAATPKATGNRPPWAG